jgi:hypothetical protein
MKLITAILVFLLGANTFAQTLHDSSTAVNAWRLINNYSTPLIVPVDTNLTNLQIKNSIYKYSISNSYLGNPGSPVLSNLFTSRYHDNDVFFLNQYLPYLNTVDNTEYFNTNKPYSYLFYTMGGKSENREETFEFFFTQNIKPKLNFGFKYDVISTKGQYRYLNIKKNSFRVFSSYTGKQYIAHASFNLNRLKNDENGGIIDSSFRNNDYNKSIKELSTEFTGSGSPYYTSDAQNRIRYYDLMISQRLKLFTLGGKPDSKKTDSLRSFAEPILTYVFKINRASKTYSHNPNPYRYYDTMIYNPYRTLDSVSNFKMLNTLQLEFKTAIKGKVQAGIYGLLGYYYENYNFFSAGPDSITFAYDTARYKDNLESFNQKVRKENTYIETGIYGNFWKRVTTRFSGNLYFAGQKAGQTLLQGQLDSKLTILRKEYDFGVKASLENKYPDYLLNNYYSNNYMWTQDKQNLSQENWVHLSSKIVSPSNYFDLSGNYYLIRDYIYFNDKAQPENYKYSLSYFSIEADKTFRVWKFCSANELAYQYSENQNILPLPDFAIHNSTYLDYTFRFKKTNGELGTMLGVDVYYARSFNGYNYSPALAEFYIQNNDEAEKIGDHPIVDAFLNVKLKAVHAFFKLQHFNSGWYGQNYYSSIHYPYNKLAFKFGISWTFYD